MDVREPQKRRRGFFLDSESGEPDTGEHEAAEGVATRTRITRPETPRQFASVRRNRPGDPAAGVPGNPGNNEGRPPIRSGSVTGSRQRAHLHR
jgi:hypothetical protein